MASNEVRTDNEQLFVSGDWYLQISHEAALRLRDNILKAINKARTTAIDECIGKISSDEFVSQYYRAHTLVEDAVEKLEALKDPYPTEDNKE